MLVDHQTYRLKPGSVPAYLDLYQQNGMAAQTRHLGQPLAYLFSETGELDTLVHLWAYEDAADRAASARTCSPIRNGEILAPQCRGRAPARAADLPDDSGAVRADHALTNPSPPSADRPVRRQE